MDDFPDTQEENTAVRKPRVVITGLGAVAPNGVGTEAFWNALVAGRSGIDHLRRFDASAYPSQIAGEVKGFQPTAYLEAHEAKRMPRVSQFASAAVKMAFQDAGLHLESQHSNRVGVCFGTSTGKAEIFEKDHLPFLTKGVRGVHPLSLLEFSPHAVSSHVAMALGVSGVCNTVSSGCTAGLDVVQWGYQQIELGRATVMAIGGAEALLTPFAFGVACAVGALSCRNDAPQQASRPFDLHRDGLVLGEGAGALILEEFDQAQRRGATIYAEILGYATAREGQDFVKCDLRGAVTVQVMETALYQAGVSKQRIDYINAHGNGLRDYDTAETNAIKTVFGPQAYHIPVSSIKSMIGQPFAAAGALQLVASCLTLRHGVIPPTINYDTPDPQCDLDYVPQRARRARVQTLLAHAHGMGGTDSALVLGTVAS
jgi:3-oxoacyl-[acyl-carrier-protein] synthase II